MKWNQSKGLLILAAAAAAARLGGHAITKSGPR